MPSLLFINVYFFTIYSIKYVVLLKIITLNNYATLYNSIYMSIIRNVLHILSLLNYKHC